jgi:hypothetical protein
VQRDKSRKLIQAVGVLRSVNMKLIESEPKAAGPFGQAGLCNSINFMALHWANYRVQSIHDSIGFKCSSGASGDRLMGKLCSPPPASPSKLYQYFFSSLIVPWRGQTLLNSIYFIES